MSWLPVLAVAGLATFLTRLSFIALLGRFEAPPMLEAALRMVPPAVLSAIIASELLVRGGAVELSLANPRLLAGALAGAMALWRRNVLLTIGTGLAALWALQGLGLR